MNEELPSGLTAAPVLFPQPKPVPRQNIMRQPYIEKVVLNIGVGEAGEPLAKAEKVLGLLTGSKPVRTRAKVTNRDWGLKVGLPIGVKVTLRGKKAEEFLKKALWVKDNKISLYAFDDEGNFSFGISDYTGFQGMKYDPAIGIFGLNVSVTFRRKGNRIATRKRNRHPIPRRNRLSPAETIAFIKNKFNVEIVE